MIPFESGKIVAVILALVALVGAVGGAWYMVDSRAYARGQAAANAIWQAREAKELASANAQILMLEEKARRSERAAQIAVNQTNEARRKADEAEKSKVAVVAGAVSDGLAGLCHARTAAAEDPGEHHEGAASTATARADAGDRAEFFAAAGEFFSSEAARADAVTRLLGQAQAYIRTALETCNGP